MKKWLAALSAFLTVYVFFLVAFIPANFVTNKVKLPDNIQLGNVSGSIWQSKIDTVLIEKTLINQVNINVNWLSTILFNPSIDITFGGSLYQGPEGHFNAKGFMSDLTISDLFVSVDANNLAQQLPLPIPVEAKNTISVTINEFVLGQPVCQQLVGNLQWSNAAITALSEQVPLGTLNAILSCVKGKAVVTLDENNDLGVSFTAQLDKGGAISGNGYLTPHNKLPKAVEQVLPFLGRQDQQGRYRLAF